LQHGIILEIDVISFKLLTHFCNLYSANELADTSWTWMGNAWGSSKIQ